jgi:hypothetical protein
MQTLFLKSEPTNDSQLIVYYQRCVNLKKRLEDHRDIVGHDDPDRSREVVRWPWYFRSKPRKGDYVVRLNCGNMRAQ